MSDPRGIPDGEASRRGALPKGRSVIRNVNPAWFVRPNGYDASRTIHGVGHTSRVLVHALDLADALDLVTWERDALAYAALWHDIGRTNDDVDYYHGAKSAGKAVALGLHCKVAPRVYETALYAITHHCGSEVHGERAASRVVYRLSSVRESPCERVDEESALRVFRLLKDADGLDRVRLGDLDVSHLRYAVSRTRVERAHELLLEIP